jgi:hypothetical protein
MHAGNPVAASQNRPCLGDEGGTIKILDLFLDDLGNFVGAELHG